MLNFSIAYGKTAHGLSKDFGVSVREAQNIVEKWYVVSAMMISLLLVSFMSLKSQVYHSYRSLILQENRRSNVHLVMMNT